MCLVIVLGGAGVARACREYHRARGGARLELLYTRTAPIQGGLTEGPAVAPDGSIYFTDIPEGADRGLIVRYDPATRKTSVFTDDSGKANGLMFDAHGRLVACEGSDQGGRRVSRWDVETGKRTTLADRFEGKRYNAPNDLSIDEQGHYFTDPHAISGTRPRELDIRTRLSDRRQRPGQRDPREVEKPNGIAISPDQHTLYVADTNNGGDTSLSRRSKADERGDEGLCISARRCGQGQRTAYRYRFRRRGQLRWNDRRRARGTCI